MSRPWNRYGVRALSVGLLVVGAIGGVYLGRDRVVRQPDAAVQPILRAEADETQLLKLRQNEHAAARAWQRQAESDAAAKAAESAKDAADQAHALEQRVVAAKKAAEKAKAAGSGPDVPYTGTIPTSCKEFSGNRAVGCALTLDAGYGIDQFPCLNKLWNKESGWNARATNKSSGAYGIPQAFPGSKMSSIADDWRTNPATQIKWGLGYIRGRYKSPCGAWSHFQDAGSY